MKHFILIALIAFSFSAQAQYKFVPLHEVKSHEGDSVSTVGKVFSTKYLSAAKNSPTLLNIGGDHPNQLLTVVIYGNDRKNFESLSLPVEEYYKGKMLKINGKVELYQGKPQIVVRDYTAFEEITIVEIKAN